MKTESISVMLALIAATFLCIKVVSGTPPQVDNFVIRRPVPRIEDELTPVTMYLDCSGSGNPPPTFQFKRNNAFINNDYPDKRLTVQDNTLIVKNLNRSDAGVYICMAKNQFGEVLKELDVKVRVLGQFSAESRAEKDTRDHSITLYKEASLPCPPRSYTYPLIIEWGSVPLADNARARIKRIPISNRVFYGNDGSLNFANVLERDLSLINDDYRGIQCLISVGLGTRASNKFKLRKDRSFGSNYEREPNFAASMDRNTIIVKDQESIFTCGGFGRPTPTVEWYKDGTRIIDRGDGTTNFIGYTLNQQVELRIVRPRKEDEGVYRCWIRNKLGAKYKDANLLVHYRPTWLKEIKDVTMPVQSSHLFNCSADAKPRATYEWYKNGAVLTQSDNIKIDKGVLRIVNARLIDKGMYVCMARNQHGSITTQAFANVEAIKPKFETRLPDPMYLFRGRIGRIPCNPTGGPIPTKTWYKDQRTVDKSFTRYSVDANGTLIINNVQDIDKGRYRCVAKNTKGSDETSASVIIVQPTVITQAPEAPNGGSTIKQGRDLVLVCDASYDKKLQLRIDWRKDGELIKTFDQRFSLEQRVGDAAPRLLIINNLKFEDRGNYTCNAYTVLSTTANIKSMDTKSSVLSVSAPPEAPSSLKLGSVNDCDFYKPRVTWTVGESNADTMKYVIVQYTSEFPEDANIWYTAGRSYGESANQFEFGSRLNPIVLPGNAAIKFRAIAVNQVGPSLPSLPTKGSICRTPAKRPSKNPVNVRLVANDSSNFDIMWDRMRLIDQNGPDFQYQVSYRIVGQATWRRVNVTNSTYKYTVSQEGIFIQYEICLLAYNRKGPSTAPMQSCIKEYTWQKKPEIAPGGLRVTKIGYTDVNLAWNAPQISSPGNIKGYRIYYWNVTKPFRPVITRGEKKRRRRRAVAVATPTAEKPFVAEHLVGTDIRLLQNVSELVPALRYLVSISAFNSGGEGPRSNAIAFETRATKSGIPDNIKMTVYGDVLHVQWESPLQPNGITTGFIMRVVPKRDFQAKKSADHIVVDRIDREYYIRGMTPCKFYEVWIAAMNQAGEGQYYRKRVAVSYPDIPGTPKLPRVVPYDANAVNITYKLPGYGGLPTSFSVHYKHKDAAYYDANTYFDSMTVKQNNFLKQPWQTVKGLPELEYAFWTVGHNKLGNSIPSDRVISQVMPYTRPGIRTSEGPWYSSRWFVGALTCVLFVLLVLIVILILINTRGGKYDVGSREKSHGGWNGQPATEFHRLEDDEDGQREPPAAMQTTTFTEAQAPPRYPSQYSIEKKPPSDDQDSLDDYGEDTRFTEDGSFIGQYGEEKRREAEEEEDEEDPNASMFI